MGALFRRDLSAHLSGGAATGLVFFLALVATLPFAIGPDLPLLSRIGPGILWVGALLSTLLSLDRLFQADREDGTLDLLLTGPAPLPLVVFAKCAALWCGAVAPLVAASPLLGLFLALEPAALGTVALSLLIGTPALVFIGAVGAALAVSLPRGGLLVSVLVLPLAIPVLIFGVSAARASGETDAPFAAPLMILCALSLLFAVVGPLAAAAALRACDD